MDHIRQSNRPLRWLQLDRIQANWVGRQTSEATKEQREKKEGKGDSWSQTDCQKKRSEALSQMQHSCKSDSQTLAETLPSFLGWRKLCSLTFFLLSPSRRLLSPQALQYPGIKATPLPPSLPLAYFLRPNSSMELSL